MLTTLLFSNPGKSWVDRAPLWWDDANLEEARLVNLARRDGAPLTIRTEDGKPLVEGKDFEPVRDSRMGVRLWKGSYVMSATSRR